MEMTNVSEIPQQLSTARPTPICDLTPEISDQASRAVRGIVTITWPYNSVKGSFAFILAEPDFRLRRNRGQVRVNFTGSAAKALGECGLGGNDDVYLSLDGAEWEPEEAKKRQSLPGAGIDWQLKFSNKLLLKATLGETHETKVISIDPSVPAEPTQPIEEQPVETPHPRDSPPPPPPPQSPTLTPAKDIRITRLNDEYESPAFVKRARLSYGSLFEDGFDIFEDDGGVRGKGRKRTRFGRDSSAWRYSSQSPSPEPPAAASRAESSGDEEEHPASPPAKPEMADDGCQTMELDISAPSPVPAPTNISSQLQESPAITETLPNSQHGLVDQGVQASRKELPPTSSIAIQTLAPTDVSQHPSVDIPPFAGNHELGVAGSTFQSPWEPEAIASSTQLYAEGLPMHDQTGGLLLTGPGDGMPDYHHTGFEDTEQTNLSYSTTDRDNFVTDVENSKDASRDGEQEHPFYNVPHMPYPPLDIVGGEGARSSSSDVHNDYPPSYLEDSQAFSRQPIEAQLRTLGEETQDSLAPFSAEAAPTSWTAVNNAAEALSVPQAHRLGSAEGQSPETPLVIDEDESDNESEPAPAPAPMAVEHTLTNGRAGPPEIYEDAEAEDDADAIYSDEDEPESDDEMGGDYDTRNYVGPNNDEDDSHDDDLRPHELEPQFDDGQDWDEEDELEEEEEERRYEMDSENESDMDEEDEEEGEENEEEEQAPRPAIRVSQSAPMVIDLISSSGEDEDEDDEDESGDEDDFQQPQLQPTPNGSVHKENPLSRARRTPDDEFESQEEDMSEDLSVTSDIRGAFNQGETVEDEQAENVEEADSVGGEQQEEAPPEGGDTSHTIVESRMDKTQPGAKATTIDERDPSMKHPLEPIDGSKDDEAVVIPQLQERETIPFTAAEGLEILSQTVNREDEAEDDENCNMLQVNRIRTSTPATEDAQKVSQSSDVEMAGSEAVDGDEPIVHEDIGETQVKEVDMVDETVRGQAAEAATSNEDMEPVDPIKSSPGNSPNVHSIETSEVLGEVSRNPLPAPSLPPLTQSFPSQVTQLKSEIPPREPIMPESRPPADQLPTPLDTQLTDTTEVQEMPAVSASMEVDKPYDIIQRTEVEENFVTQVKIISEEVIEQDQVQTIEIMTEQTEQFDSVHIELQSQTSVAGEQLEELSQSSQSHEPITNISSRTPVDINDMIQASLRGEDPQAVVEPLMIVNALDEDSSGVSSSFRSQMEGDEELQARILEDNSHVLEEREEFRGADVSSPQASDDDAQYEDAKATLETETQESIGRPPSPDLGFDDATKPDDSQPESSGNQQRQENIHTLIESDHESLDEESQQDPSVELARAANATKRRGKSHRATLEVDHPPRLAQDAHSAYSSDEEDSSLQLARASMNALPKEEESSSLVEAKLQLARHLRDELPDCTQLQVLRHHIGQSLDVVAVAMMQPPDPQRAKGGPREYMMSFTITDQSTAPSAVVEVQLYRPHKDVLPVVKPGDVVLLRKFHVVSLQGKGFGLRTGDDSSWAVWEVDNASYADTADGDDGDGDGGIKIGPPQIRGPPVEAVEKEARHAAYLREWFGLLDESARAKLERANQKIVGAKKAKRKS